jgi:hypothetical protein
MGKLAKAPALPNANNRNNSTAALLAQRTMFAERGFALNKARLYNIGATAQQIAAPKAANSPSTTALIVKPLKNVATKEKYKFSMIRQQQKLSCCLHQINSGACIAFQNKNGRNIKEQKN